MCGDRAERDEDAGPGDWSEPQEVRHAGLTATASVSHLLCAVGRERPSGGEAGWPLPGHVWTDAGTLPVSLCDAW